MTARAVEVGRETRAAQGLPPRVEDRVVLAQAARLVRRAAERERDRQEVVDQT